MRLAYDAAPPGRERGKGQADRKCDESIYVLNDENDKLNVGQPD
jgi:hypothetical protein